MSGLRAALLGEAPTSFRILLPPGWRQFGVDDASRAALEALIRDRLKPAGRPDLDAQLRSMLARFALVIASPLVRNTAPVRSIASARAASTMRSAMLCVQSTTQPRE